MKKLSVIVGVLLLVLVTATACETGAKSVVISGPETIETSGGGFTATATGATALYGIVNFWWYIDENSDEFPQTAEILDNDTVVADITGQAVSTLLWKPASTYVGKTVVLSMYTRFAGPGSDLLTPRRDAKSVAVTE